MLHAIFASCAHPLKVACGHLLRTATAGYIYYLPLIILLSFLTLRWLKSPRGTLITLLASYRAVQATADGVKIALLPKNVVQPQKSQAGPSGPAKKHRNRKRRGKKTKQTQKEPHTQVQEVPQASPLVSQPLDAFLVLDVEATCQQGSSFDYPNEIIELPVCLMRWKDKTEDGVASQLEVVDEFRTYVKPTWRTTLSQFCMDLTGITQDIVDDAPKFSAVLDLLQQFLVKNGLIDPDTNEQLMRFCWCTDGPHDIRDFFVKQCFISQVDMPDWMKGDVMDVRPVVSHWISLQPRKNASVTPPRSTSGMKRPLNLSLQLQALGLAPFEGRQHCGMDDARNVARIVAELPRKGIRLLPNTPIHANRRWSWMGKPGQILEACG